MAPVSGSNTPALVSLLTDSSPPSNRHSERLTAKRQRESESPIHVYTAPLTSTVLSQQRRALLFDSLARGDSHPGVARPILSVEHLTEQQLSKCFEILHACGTATDLEATLAKTRASVESFLDAVFNDWSSSKAGELLRPELEFFIEAAVVAGRICVSPDRHENMEACKQSKICKAEVSAVATYSCNPAMLKVEFSMVDPFSNVPETICPLGREDIKWVTTDWHDSLGQTLQNKIISKIHKFNKHLAVWQARKLIQAWSKGSLSMGCDARNMGFLGRDAANAATLGFSKEGRGQFANGLG
ncbi:hypothetical protein HIM_07209 [Hirsutella minnesotensis 3608]|uniref:Uncharacterized protein n=1 Tax=Hirsutella minnesotensis 3608 TaxID=1043627 RepID=A0A0F7ZNA6_9HYPO|nr:hypothetical protein HIM_07209 [Hirsutella minnesotensis 3608]